MLHALTASSWLAGWTPRLALPQPRAGLAAPLLWLLVDPIVCRSSKQTSVALPLCSADFRLRVIEHNLQVGPAACAAAGCRAFRVQAAVLPK